MALWKARVTVQRTKDEHLIVTVEADTEEEAKDAAMDEDQWLDVEHEETEPQEGGPVSLRGIELEDDEDDDEDDVDDVDKDDEDNVGDKDNPA